MNGKDAGGPARAIEALGRSLATHLDALRPWLELADREWSTRPAPDAWSVGEIVEHVVRMQRYVLLLVEKIGRRALRRLEAGERPPATLEATTELEILADADRAWTSPEHMRPTEGPARDQLALELAEQRRRCLEWLARLPAGEGALHSIRMSVVNRRLDLYGYLRLIDVHLARHLAQLERTLARVTGPAPPAPRAPPPPAP